MSVAAQRPPIVVDVLTGFLGAGKTTLLRNLIKRDALPDTAILINELSALPVDQRLIGATGVPTAVTAGGCLCCTIDGDVRGGLLRLLDQQARGVLPSFSRVLVETSGIADPAVVASTIQSDRLLQPRFRFGSIVTVVDVLNALETITSEDEALSQIIAADRIVLTKTDITDNARKDEVMAAVAAINPLASVADPADTDNPWSLARPPKPYPASLRAVAIDHTLSAFVLHWPEPVDWAVFATWLSALLHRHGSSILRVKGVMKIAEAADPEPVVIQAVRHVVYPPEHLAGVSDVAGAEITVIARDVDAERVRRSFAAFMRLGRKSARQNVTSVSNSLFPSSAMIAAGVPL